MRKHVLAVLATLVVGLGVSFAAPAAQGAESARNCATHTEFERVKLEMSAKKVRNIFGYRGERQNIDDTRFVLYWYSCKGQKAAVVWFKQGAGSYKKKWDTVR